MKEHYFTSQLECPDTDIKLSKGTSNWDDSDELVVTDTLVPECENKHVKFANPISVERTLSRAATPTSDSSSDSSSSSDSQESMVEHENETINIEEVKSYFQPIFKCFKILFPIS